MNSKKIYENYLTVHYTECDKTRFDDPDQVQRLLNGNKIVLDHNLGSFFEANIKSSDEILDLGCGYGSFLNFLTSRGYTNITGVDLSEEEIKFCRKKFPKCKYYCEDIISFVSRTNKKYKIIYLSHVLEHIPKNQTEKLLRGIKAIMSDSSHLLIISPNSSAYFNSMATRYGDMTHETGFTDNSLYQLFRVLKFGEVKVMNYYGPGNALINPLRSMALNFFEMFIQLLGYDKQKIYTPSLLLLARK